MCHVICCVVPLWSTIFGLCFWSINRTAPKYETTIFFTGFSLRVEKLFGEWFTEKFTSDRWQLCSTCGVCLSFSPKRSTNKSNRTLQSNNMTFCQKHDPLQKPDRLIKWNKSSDQVITITCITHSSHHHAITSPITRQ